MAEGFCDINFHRVSGKIMINSSLLAQFLGVLCFVDGHKKCKHIWTWTLEVPKLWLWKSTIS